MRKWIDADRVNAALDRIREEAWLHDIPSPTVPEYIEHHDAIQQIMLVIDKERKLLSDAADVAPVRHGHWVKAERRGCVSYADAYAECDHCHKVIFDAWNFDYCPRCGARMDGGDGE